MVYCRLALLKYYMLVHWWIASCSEFIHATDLHFLVQTPDSMLFYQRNQTYTTPHIVIVWYFSGMLLFLCWWFDVCKVHVTTNLIPLWSGWIFSYYRCSHWQDYRKSLPQSQCSWTLIDRAAEHILLNHLHTLGLQSAPRFPLQCTDLASVISWVISSDMGADWVVEISCTVNFSS